MFSCLQILEAFLWFVLITLLNVTLIILTLSVSRLLNLLLRLVAFLDRKSGSAGMPRPISYAVFCLKKKKRPKVGTKVVAKANRASRPAKWHHRPTSVNEQHNVETIGTHYTVV